LITHTIVHGHAHGSQDAEVGDGRRRRQEIAEGCNNYYIAFFKQFNESPKQPKLVRDVTVMEAPGNQQNHVNL
jgi:hypothetical protein